MSRQQGIYDISIEDYHNGEGISRSGILEFRRTPYHFWNIYLSPDRPPREKGTESTILGNAYHTFILEPDKFDERYIVATSQEKIPKVPLLRDVGREAYDLAKKNFEVAKQKQDDEAEEFAKKAVGKEILSAKNYDLILAMKAKLKTNTMAWDLVEGARYEKSIYWNDPDTGLLCKARPDILHNNMIGDLKTTNDASQREFERSIFKYGYHIQAGMISEGLRIVKGVDIREYFFIPQEKEFPHASAIYQLSQGAIEQGIYEFKKALVGIKQCYEKNEWPSYNCVMVELPAYATFGD